MASGRLSAICHTFVRERPETPIDTHTYRLVQAHELNSPDQLHNQRIASTREVTELTTLSRRSSSNFGSELVRSETMRIETVWYADRRVVTWNDDGNVRA